MMSPFARVAGLTTEGHMSEVVTLKVVNPQKETPREEEVLVSYDKIMKEGRDFLAINKNTGFVVLIYTKDAKGGMTSMGNFAVSDPMDLYALPGFAAERIRNLRDED